MNPKFKLIPLGLAGLISAATLVGCGSDKVEPHQATAVYVTDVAQIASTRSREFMGTVRAHVESDVGFRTGGKVLRRAVEVGDRVKAGQVIAVLDPVDYNLGVAAAEDQVKQAKAQAQLDSSDQARFGRLKADGSVAAADHERQTYKSQSSDARLDQALRQLQVSKNLASYATLVAPFDGVVTNIRVEVGQVVAEGQPVLSVARDGDREVVADLPEGTLADIRALQAKALPWDDRGAPIELKLREVSPLASAQGRLFRVKFTESQAGSGKLQALPLGSTAELVLQYPAQAAVVLPISALVNAGAKPFVWTVDASGERLTQVPVKVTVSNSDSVSVEGLPEHARVVTVGAQKLDAGMKVRAINRRLDETLKVARSAT